MGTELKLYFGRLPFFTIAAVSAPGLVVLFLWLPVVQHYYVSRVEISDQVAEKARRSPSDERLEELGDFRFFGDKWSDKQELIAAADKILAGRLEFSGSKGRNISMPFDPQDLEKGGSQLFIASLGIPRILLSAYETSGREEFFRGAANYITSWAEYENSAWLPKNLLWNDHAVSERVLVLAELWRLYRQHSHYHPEAAKVILELAVRHSRLLARPSHFTFNTNHGVMQNLALWHFCLAFPDLPNVEYYRRLALERMEDQFAFYVNDEGVILEHSPGYQKSGLQFMTLAMRYLTLLEVPIPPLWIEKYRKAQDFYAQLRLPDGNLPIFGDTGNSPYPQGPLVAQMDTDGKTRVVKYRSDLTPSRENSVYPIAGYAVWWDGLEKWPDAENLAQTMIGWSYFPGQAHKHADEMSLWLWAGGQTWWANVGYWPHGLWGRSEAESWGSSNAPHLANERTESSRRTSLQSFGSSNRLAFIDLERSGPEGYTTRRQVIWMKPNLWLVLDHARTTGKGRTRTVWTTSHDVRVARGDVAGSFTLHGANNKMILDAFFFGLPEASITSVKGSRSPFGGWEVVGSKIEPTSAVIVEQPAANAWSAAAWSLHPAKEISKTLPGSPSIMRAENGQSWKVSFPTRSGETVVERNDNTISVMYGTENGPVSDRLIVQKAPDHSTSYDAIRQSYVAASDKYQRFRDYFGYRVKLTWLLLGIFLFQEALFAYLKRRKPGQHAVARRLSLVCWLAGGALLTTQLGFFIDLYTRISIF